MGMLGGGCLCGAVRYEVEDSFRYALNCHCSQCRRATGAAFKPFAGIEIGKLRVMRGTQLALEMPVYAAADVPAGSLTQRAMQGAWELATGWIRPGTARQ